MPVCVSAARLLCMSAVRPSAAVVVSVALLLSMRLQTEAAEALEVFDELLESEVARAAARHAGLRALLLAGVLIGCSL